MYIRVEGFECFENGFGWGWFFGQLDSGLGCGWDWHEALVFKAVDFDVGGDGFFREDYEERVCVLVDVEDWV